MRKILFYLMILMLCLSMTCSKDDDAPDVNDMVAVRYNNTSYAMDFGVLYYEEILDNHVMMNIGLTDGSYYPFLLTVGNFSVPAWDTQDAGIEVDGKFCSAGNSVFRTGTFEVMNVVDINDPGLAGISYITQAYVGIDMNNDNDVGESEHIKVVEGTVEVNGDRPNYTITYDLKTESGDILTGSYTGEFLDDSEYN